jgi:hypothetical protein
MLSPCSNTARLSSCLMCAHTCASYHTSTSQQVVSFIIPHQTSCVYDQPHACVSHKSRECVVLLLFAAKLSSTSSFSPALASPTLNRFAQSQPSLLAPATTLTHNPSHRWRDRFAPTSIPPHHLVKINFYSINKT